MLQLYLDQMGGEIMSFGLLANLLHDEDSCLGVLHQWLLAAHDHSVAEDLVLYHRLQAQQTISVSNIVGSLRRLPAVDFSRIFERVSSVEALLNLDPSGVYGKCNSATKDAYRKAVEQLARGARICDETAVAEATLKLAAEHPPGSVEANAGTICWTTDKWRWNVQLTTGPPGASALAVTSARTLPVRIFLRWHWRVE